MPALECKARSPRPLGMYCLAPNRVDPIRGACLHFHFRRPRRNRAVRPAISLGEPVECVPGRVERDRARPAIRREHAVDQAQRTDGIPMDRAVLVIAPAAFRREADFLHATGRVNAALAVMARAVAAGHNVQQIEQLRRLAQPPHKTGRMGIHAVPHEPRYAGAFALLHVRRLVLPQHDLVALTLRGITGQLHLHRSAEDVRIGGAISVDLHAELGAQIGHNGGGRADGEQGIRD